MKNCILEKIDSKYVFKTIFSYLNEDYIYCLIIHSKSLQSKLNIDINKYKKKFFFKIYPYYYYEQDYDYDLCITNLSFLYGTEKEDLTNNELENMKDFYKFYFFDLIKELDPNGFSKYIDFCCPIFDSLLETEYFGKYFTILVRMDYISQNNLIDYYIKYFEKLNKLNLKYSLEFKYFNLEDIKFLKICKINFNQIKKLSIVYDEGPIFECGCEECDSCEGRVLDSYNKDILKNIDSFLNTLFSFNNIECNLISLTLNTFIAPGQPYFVRSVQMNPDFLEGLNSLKSLKHLYLYNFGFSTTFILKLDNLEKLLIDHCKNMTFKENSFLNLINLTIKDCSFIIPNPLLKCPKLETLEYTKNDYFFDTQLIIDLTSIRNLKVFASSIENFLLLELTLLEKIHLFPKLQSKNIFVYDKNKEKIEKKVKFNNKYNYFSDYIEKETEKKMIEKLCSIKSLKKIDFQIYYIIDENEQFNINKKSISVKDMEIKINLKKNKNYNLCGIQNIFCNLTNLTCKIFEDNSYKINEQIIETKEAKLEIIENPNNKITSFNIIIDKLNSGIKFFIQSYENIESMNFEINDLNFKTNIPIFNDECNIVFKSLKKFSLNLYLSNFDKKKIEIDSKINNLFNNIDKIPNLKEFTFSGFNDMLDEISYKNIIKKILSLKIITSINLEPCPISANYSRKELAELFPDICLNKIKEIRIMKIYKEKKENEIWDLIERRGNFKRLNPFNL